MSVHVGIFRLNCSKAPVKYRELSVCILNGKKAQDPRGQLIDADPSWDQSGGQWSINVPSVDDYVELEPETLNISSVDVIGRQKNKLCRHIFLPWRPIRPLTALDQSDTAT